MPVPIIKMVIIYYLNAVGTWRRTDVDATESRRING